MQPKLLVLKLILDELGVPTKIGTVADRVRIQKAIYLTQRAGVDLGYGFGWYKRGPYSPRLATDYYRLQNELAMSPPAPDEKLVSAIVRALDSIRPLLDVPKDVSLPDEKWLELIASLDYRRHTKKETLAEATAVIRDEKEDLAHFVPSANKRLSQSQIQK